MQEINPKAHKAKTKGYQKLIFNTCVTPLEHCACTLKLASGETVCRSYEYMALLGIFLCVKNAETC